MNIRTIRAEDYKLITELAAHYEENYGNWAESPEGAVWFYRNAFEDRNKLQALLAQGKAVLA
jgi:hypothetical protein